MKKYINIFICVAALLAALPARAQYLGTTSPQSTQATLASGTSCTGSAQNFTTGVTPKFNNLGQTQHYAYIQTTGATSLTMQIFGLDPSGNAFLISDTATIGLPVAGSNPTLTATGYYPNIRVVVTCSPNTATFTLNYTGTSSTSNVNAGGYLLAQTDKTIASLASAGAGLNSGAFPSPFGNSSGLLEFEFVGAGPAGSSIAVTCQTANGLSQQFTYTLATTNGLTQTFPIPPATCPNVSVVFVSGGASASTYDVDYVFLPPGTGQTNFYTHITGTTATVVKSGPGTVHSLVVGTAAAGTISLFDLASGSCTGTPVTGVVSVITEFASAAPPPPFYLYDVLFNNGICVKASAAMDITVGAI